MDKTEAKIMLGIGTLGVGNLIIYLAERGLEREKATEIKEKKPPDEASIINDERCSSVSLKKRK